MKTYSILDAASCSALRELAQKYRKYFRESNGVRRRIGFSKGDNLSVYAYWKKWQWPRALRLQVLELLPAEIRDQHNECWFLHFDHGGHFDCWASSCKAFRCLMIPLQDGGRVFIEGQTYLDREGQGYWFWLDHDHATPKTDAERDYICFLFLTELRSFPVITPQPFNSEKRITAQSLREALALTERVESANEADGELVTLKAEATAKLKSLLAQA